MKKYLFILIASGFVASCTNDHADSFSSQNKKIEMNDFSEMGKDEDSLETGGQGGTTPVKPPKP